MRMSYSEALHQATMQVMARDSRVIVIGEGVPDPKGIFGTTSGLLDAFGPSRVFDMPLSENAMTGICIGAALTGLHPLMVHQRIDFALLAMDQIINNAAKWHYMFNGHASVPLVVRMIIGRGWGQGPQHSQGLQALFAHIPGLKVAMPSTPYDAKGMLVASLNDRNPVMFIEHRWLHNLIDEVPLGEYEVPLGVARVLHPGTQLTIAGFSYGVVEALHLARSLADHGVSIEVLDMRTARPIDVEALLTSVRKTGHLVAVDAGWESCGLAGELIAICAQHSLSSLRKAPMRVTYPGHPTPTSPYMAAGYFPDGVSLLDCVLEQLSINLDPSTQDKLISSIKQKGHLDVPDRSFKGPF